jgi:hypothetical protein
MERNPIDFDALHQEKETKKEEKVNKMMCHRMPERELSVCLVWRQLELILV